VIALANKCQLAIGLMSPVSIMTSSSRPLIKSTYLYQNVPQNDENEESVTPLEITQGRYGSFSSLTSLVGGGELEGGEGGIEGNLSAESIPNRQKVIMTVALFSTYLTVMGAKCALPSTLSIITSSDSGLWSSMEPQQLMSIVLTISTGAISVGKFLLGPVIDKFGGTLCLKVALTALMGFLGIIASTNSFRVFALSWIMVDFIFSSCWASCLNAIHRTFCEEEWPSRIGLLAVAGRVGNAISFFTFASILQWAQKMQSVTSVNNSWRMVFWASSLIQVVPLLMLKWFDKVSFHFSDGDNRIGSTAVQSSETSSGTSMKDSVMLLRGEMTKLPFWMHLISRSCLMVVASFLLFVPSYMTNAFGMSSSSAARVGSLYALGSLISVSFGAKRFSSSRTRTKLIATIGLLGSLLLCSLLQMAYISGAITMTSAGGALSMFIWGLSFSIPFYIPPSMYALRQGGRKSSATIADAFDLVGFMMLAWFNGFVASRQQYILRSWLPTFTILTTCSLSSLVSLSVALASEF